MSNLRPFLTGFPTKFYGSAKRKQQEIFIRRRAELAASSLGEHALQFEFFLPADLLQKLSTSKRNRHYGSVTTFWAWLSQLMDENASCSKAVSMVQAWCAQAQLPIPSSDTGAYCMARKRLAKSFLAGIHGKRHSGQSSQSSKNTCLNEVAYSWHSVNDLCVARPFWAVLFEKGSGQNARNTHRSTDLCRIMWVGRLCQTPRIGSRLAKLRK